MPKISQYPAIEVVDPALDALVIESNNAQATRKISLEKIAEIIAINDSEYIAELEQAKLDAETATTNAEAATEAANEAAAGAEKTYVPLRNAVAEEALRSIPTPTLAGFYNYATGVFTANADRKSVLVDLSVATEIQVTTTISGSLTALAVYFDSEMNYLGFEKRGVDGVPETVTDYVLTIPASAVFVGIQCRNDFILSWTGTETYIEANVIKSEFLQVQEDIDSLSEATKFPFTGTVQNGYYRFSTGAFVSNSLRRSMLVAVPDSRKAYHSGTYTGSDTAGAVYFDSGMNFLSAQFQGLDGGTVLTNNRQLLTLPPNTAFIGFSARADLNVPYAFEFEQVYSKGLKPFDGLNIVTFGDSITMLTDNWTQTFRQVLGVQLTNMAISGSRYAWATTTVETTSPPQNTDKDNVIWNQILKWEATSPSAPDAIIIAAGTNDLSQAATWSITVGNLTDAFAQPLASTSQRTTANAIRHVLQKLQTDYPNTKIFVTTPIQGVASGRSWSTLKPYADVIVDVARRLNVTVIDCFNESGIIDLYEVDGGAGKYLYDGVHPNFEGAKLHAMSIINRFTQAYLNL